MDLIYEEEHVIIIILVSSGERQRKLKVGRTLKHKFG
jgi:hypothetical protein